MFLLLVFVAFTSLALADRKEDCQKMRADHIMDCCKDKKISLKYVDQTKECFDSPDDSESCDTQICIAKKMNFAGSTQGTFDKAALEKHLQNDFADNSPQFLEAALGTCVNGNLTEFGSDAICDLVKLKNCLLAVKALTCKNWKEDDHCKGAKDLVSNCLTLKM